MSIVLIGSRALSYHLHISANGDYKKHPFYRYDNHSNDYDIIGPLDACAQFAKDIGCYSWVPVSENKWLGEYKDLGTRSGIGYLEAEIVWDEGTSTDKFYAYARKYGRHCSQFNHVAPIEMLYALKMSHRFLRNSVHFEKTRKDIEFIRDVFYPGKDYMGPIRSNTVLWEMFIRRENETYNYAHPKLNVKKTDFFVDEYENMVDHDYIHELVSVINNTDRPAYLEFKSPGSDVWCDKKLWDECDLSVKLNAVVEESTVLAMERSQIPFGYKPDPSWSYKFALQKVCTSITSGWFREFAWENYFLCKEMMIPGYANKIKRLLEMQ